MGGGEEVSVLTNCNWLNFDVPLLFTLDCPIFFVLFLFLFCIFFINFIK